MFVLLWIVMALPALRVCGRNQTTFYPLALLWINLREHVCHWLASGDAHSGSWLLHWQASATPRASVPHQGCKQMEKCAQENKHP
jgi:hypothetical protein